MHKGKRSKESYRYRFVKHMKHRVQKHIREAKNIEEIKVWKEVDKWFSTLIGRDKIMLSNGSIGLRDLNEE